MNPFHNVTFNSPAMSFNNPQVFQVTGLILDTAADYYMPTPIKIGIDRIMESRGVTHEQIGKAAFTAAHTTAVHVGGGPSKTIDHGDGTKTIIHYHGTGVDAESTIIKVKKDGSWDYVN